MKGTSTALTVFLVLTLVFACGCSGRSLVKGESRRGNREDLVKVLSRIDGPEGEKAFRALVKRGKEVVPDLVALLKHPDPAVAEAAAGCLGEIKDPSAVPHLSEFLRSSRPRRYAAAWALGEIGDPRAVFPLVEALEDENFGIVKMATRALIKLGRPVVPVLIDELKEGSPQKVEALLIALEDIGDPRAEEAVIEKLEGGETEEIRIRAAYALAKCGTKKAVPHLIKALRRGSVRMKVACSWSLGLLEAQEAVPDLKRMLEHEDVDVREWAARALENITGERVRYRNAKGEMVLPYNLYR
ncbi:MAG: HEAT repeat domain-containing protein [Deltaproteobacteria bacterium]|nr:MAG: HEAT repeat domain-containing protein [Deltaproteobacteria bacterium]